MTCRDCAHYDSCETRNMIGTNATDARLFKCFEKKDVMMNGVERKGNKKEMKIQYIFPTVMILLDAGAAIVCGTQGDVRKVIYWVAAAVLNAAVTF